MSLKDRLLSFVAAETNAKPVGYIRSFIGAAAFLRGVEADGILKRVLQPGSFRMPYFPLLPSISKSWIPVLIGIWLIAAACFIVGWKTRVSGFALAAVMCYTMLLDQQTYSNHLYLLVLITVLLSLGDAGASFSLDAQRQGTRAKVPYWPVLLLKFQLTIVYFFAAVTKLNVSYMSGETMDVHLRSSLRDVLPVYLTTRPALAVISILGIVAELFIAVALWFRGWCWLALFVGVGLHAAMVGMLIAEQTVQLQVFAIICLGLYPLFFRWPEQKIEGDGKLSQAVAQFATGPPDAELT